MAHNVWYVKWHIGGHDFDLKIDCIAFLTELYISLSLFLSMLFINKPFETSLVPNRISRLCKDFEKLHCPYLVYEVSSQWFKHYIEMWLIKCFWRIGVLNTKHCVLQTNALTIELWRNVDFQLQQISCESCIILSTMHVHAVQCYSYMMLVFSSLSKPVYRV